MNKETYKSFISHCSEAL